MTFAIQTTALTRRFAGGHGITDVALAVPTGSIYGFLGPNGAGKTTTIRLLLDLIVPDRGEILLMGQPLRRDRRAALAGVGALVESPSLYAHLSGWENLEIARRLLALPVERIIEVLARVDLADAAHRRVRDYSLGMRQRLGIALALLARPKLLVLDEPGNGLDPAGLQDLRRMLREFARRDGITVLVSSHQLAEIEQVATHVGVLTAGRLRFQGTLAQLRERARPQLLLRCDQPARARLLLQDMGEQAAFADDETLRLAPGLPAEEINRRLVGHGIGVRHLAHEDVTLESLFFGLTGEETLEQAA
jgi:ABC-type multidrug transport system ATPase subunit